MLKEIKLIWRVPGVEKDVLVGEKIYLVLHWVDLIMEQMYIMVERTNLFVPDGRYVELGAGEDVPERIYLSGKCMYLAVEK